MGGGEGDGGEFLAPDEAGGEGEVGDFTEVEGGEVGVAEDAAEVVDAGAGDVEDVELGEVTNFVEAFESSTA